MDRSAEADLIARLEKHLANGTTDMAASVRHHPVDLYVNADRWQAERDLFFRSYPLVIEVSAAIREPGDFVAKDLSGLPVLLARGDDGVVRAFLNVCRHRGNRVCLESRGNGRRFKCQYHAWTYDLEGALLTFIDREGFSDLDMDDFGLVSLPCEERNGLIWVVPDADGHIDVAQFLGEEMDQDLADLRLGDQVVFDDTTSQTPFNWKLGVDTFHEVFHLAYLHKNTVGPLFIGNLGVHDDRGLHHRYTAARKTFPKMVAENADGHDIYPHSSIVHFIFPNTFITWQMDHIEMWHFYPHAQEPGASFTNGRMLIAEAPRNDSAQRHWQNNWDVLLDTIWTEDFEAMDAIQKNFEAGAATTLAFGRNEIALQRFHEKLDQELERARKNVATDAIRS